MNFWVGGGFVLDIGAAYLLDLLPVGTIVTYSNSGKPMYV